MAEAAEAPAGLLAVDVAGLDDDGVAAHMLALQRLRARVDAACARAADVFDARAAWARDGARNGPGWVAARAPVAYGTAKADIARARALRDMPATAAAFGAGRLGREQVDVLIKARTPALAEVFDACEAVLVAEVTGLTVAAGARYLTRWAAEVRERLGRAEPDGPEPPGEPDGSRVHLSPLLEGRWALDGALDAEDGDTVNRVLDAVIDEMFHTGAFHADDSLTLSERRAIALVEALTRASRDGDDDGTARPLVLGVVHLDPAMLAGLDGPAFDVDPTGAWSERPGLAEALARQARGAGYAELADAGLVDAATIERWRCEGTFQPVYVGPGSDQLFMGRRIRLANRAQRRALRIRDGGCTFPGCHVGADRCVPHHVTYWEHDGPTDLPNLVLLCRHHHKTIHRRHFTLTRRHGTTHVTRPDGTPITVPLRARATRPRHRRDHDPPEPGTAA